MALDTLTTIYSAHTAYLQRVGSALGNDSQPYLVAIQNEIDALFKSYGDVNVTPKREAKIKEQINAISRKHLQEYTKHVGVENRELGGYEAEFAATSLDSVVETQDFESKTPSAAAVNAVATAKPIQLGENSWASYQSMLTNYWQKWTAEIDGAVQAGFIEGQSMSQISNIIYDSISVSKTGTTKKVGDKAWRSAKTMARMGVNHYANTARIAFAQDNTDIITGMTIISVIDSSTSQKCRGLDGEVIKLDDP